MATKDQSAAEDAQCDCKKCACLICRAALGTDECACCAHGCSCCGDQTSEKTCDCEDDCGCSGGDCNCGHGPCDSQTCTCACGCGGHGDAHVCPVCGMVVDETHDCACIVHRHKGPLKARAYAQCGGQVRGYGGRGPALYPRLSAPAAIGLKVLVTTDLVLKTVAISKALRSNDKGWILPLAIVNSAGVLPAYYLFSRGKK